VKEDAISRNTREATGSDLERNSIHCTFWRGLPSFFLVFSAKLLRFFGKMTDRKLPLVCPLQACSSNKSLAVQIGTLVGIIIENSPPMGRRLDSDYGKAEKRKLRVL
jgi:hypothetical protein